MSLRPLIRALPLAVLAALAFASPAHAAFPGANGKIAYSSPSTFTGTFDIFTMNPDGGVVTNVSHDPTYEVTPAWSPDGRKIAYSREVGCGGSCTTWTTVIMNRDGSGKVEFATGLVGPSWSPDGTKLALSGVRPGDADSRIYVMNVDGSGVTPITNPGSSPDIYAAWSPDGTKIAFARYVSSYQIFTVNPDGTGLTQLTNNPGTASDDPNWSPDGAKITYQSSTGVDIFVMNADGSGQTNISNSPSRYDEYPVWSPDGTKILFRANSDSLHVMNPDGTGEQDLQTFGLWPDWAPVVGKLPADDVPASAPAVTFPMVPVFRQCGSSGNTPNAGHAPPIAVGSCTPPQPSSNVARIGAQMQGTTTLTAIPGDITQGNGDQADFSITVAVSDVQTTSGLDYNPVAGGADMTTKIRLRLTDRNTGNSVPATPTDFDFAIPIDCTPTADPGTGSSCGATTTADTIMPYLVVERKSTNVQAFRVRIDDSGANGTRGDSDDRIFATQGVFVP